jgi:uncharacterized protein YdaU (DUF1376 family)
MPMIHYANTTKEQWFRIAFNLAMQLSEDNEKLAIKRLEEEKARVQRQMQSLLV